MVRVVEARANRTYTQIYDETSASLLPSSLNHVKKLMENTLYMWRSTYVIKLHKAYYSLQRMFREGIPWSPTQ